VRFVLKRDGKQDQRMVATVENIRSHHQTPTSPPDSDLTEIDVWCLFEDDSVAREIDAKFERTQAYLAAGDLDGLRKYIEAEKKQRPAVVLDK